MLTVEQLGLREDFTAGRGVYEHARFGRVITAMVTPFDDEGVLNLDAAQELASWLQNHGSEGLVVAGTTGESPTLTHEEQFDLISAVDDAVDIPVIAGTGSNDTLVAVDFTRRVVEAEIADGLLVVSPYYNKPPQEGIVDYFKKVAYAADGLPIIMYDIPGRTGRKIAESTILKLAHNVDNIVGLKDAAGDTSATVQLMKELPSDFQVYSGDDLRNLELYLAGAVGTISVASHWAGKEIAEMFDAADNQSVPARVFETKLRPSYAFESSDETPNPLPAKAMMRHLGLAVGRGRSPMVISSETEQKLERHAKRVMQQLRMRA